MMERITLQPPESIETSSPVISLAGPMQGAPDWQSTAADLIHDIDLAIVVASPRREYPGGYLCMKNRWIGRLIFYGRLVALRTGTHGDSSVPINKLAR